MQRAHYDNDGNIIIPSAHTPAVEPTLLEQAFSPRTEPDRHEPEDPTFAIDTIQWGLPEDPSEDISSLPIVQREHATQRIAEQLSSIRSLCASTLEEAHNEALHAAKQLLAEGERQVRTSAIDASHTSRGLLRMAHRFLTQPVLVPCRRKTVKRTSRGALFVLDIVRFGGTFAAIFALLFSAMNYESFIAIASAKIEPILAFTTFDTSASVQRSLAQKLREVPSLTVAGTAEEGLLAHLPSVGPPEDLLVIPSLNLRAPIVSPATDSLVREDWKQLEDDIQKGLEDGVVHYPGTAEPGQAGNFFLTGHSSYFPWAEGDYKSVFARLGSLNVGDEFWVYHGGDQHRYVIDTKKEIVPNDVTVLDQPITRRMATLMTCTPVGTTLRRLILTAQEVDPLTGEAMDVGEHQHQEARPNIKVEALPI